MPGFTLTELIDCANREAIYRHRTYAKWVREGKVTAEKAGEEIAKMEAIIKKLERLQSMESAIKPFAEAAEDLDKIAGAIEPYYHGRDQGGPWHIAAYAAARRLSPFDWKLIKKVMTDV